MKQFGAYMRAEIEQARLVFAKSVQQNLSTAIKAMQLENTSAFYTIARGSSDAAANMISYEMMAQLKKPVTTLPPSVFSLGEGLDTKSATALLFSQSGASGDLVSSAHGFKDGGGNAIAITNSVSAPMSTAADLCIDIGAGVEKAVPATKTVIATLASGMALLAAVKPEYHEHCTDAAKAMINCVNADRSWAEDLQQTLETSQHVYVIGRGCGLGAAQEFALKMKECAAIHAEAYSASEVLHGPLQLATKPLTAIILDQGDPAGQPSLDLAEERFGRTGAKVYRIRPKDAGAQGLTPVAAAALQLFHLYSVVLETTLSLGLDPDAPATLAKVTSTL